MAEQIIAAFETGKPQKIRSMSWDEFIQLFNDIRSYNAGKTQSGRGQA